MSIQVSPTLRNFLRRLPLVEYLSVQLVIGILISLLCLWAFYSLADEVVEQENLTAFDLALANELHGAATPDSTTVYRMISYIGLPGLWYVGVAVGVFFLVRKQWLHLGVWIVALIGGGLLNNALKLFFARPRPVFTDPFVIEQNFSFPSGHAMSAFIGYGLLAYFIWKRLSNHRYLRLLIVFLTVLLIVLIGISRMTLGVHYFSDVLAGYAAGGVWLVACITAMNTIYRRKRAGDPAAQKEMDLSS
jgi:membrane-associated phospholipid phosphatase